jgi:hypothetical protein
LEAGLGAVDTAVDTVVEDTEDIEAEALEPEWVAEVEAAQGPVRIAHYLEHKMAFCNEHNYIFLNLDSFSSPEVKHIIDIIKFPITIGILIF